MRAPTGLYQADLLRIGEVANVKDANAAESIGTHVFRHALEATVEAAACFLHRHNQQTADNRNVALSPRTHD